MSKVQEGIEVVTAFYEAFARRDAEAMVKHYADDVRFSDPVFPDLRGDAAKDMWRMLCERGKDLEITFKDVKVDEGSGAAHWDAHYTFSLTGHRVHNAIDASFKFANGMIVEHTDVFDFWRWSGQALGMKGKLLGWTPFVRSAVQKSAAKGLAVYRAAR